MIEFITSAAILLSSMYTAGQTHASTTDIAAAAALSTSTKPAAIVVAISSTTAFSNNAGVMVYVKEQYANEPILVDIARCESAFRQYNSKTGEVLHGAINSQDIGVMQINETYQGAKAASLGYDIDTVEGNVAYAKHLYDAQGATPWDSSSACWGNSYAVAVK